MEKDIYRGLLKNTKVNGGIKMKEEKKTIKIRLSMSVVLIIFIMMLAIVIMFCLINSLEKEKTRIENNSNLQQSINLTEKKENLEEKVIDNKEDIKHKTTENR